MAEIKSGRQTAQWDNSNPEYRRTQEIYEGLLDRAWRNEFLHDALPRSGGILIGSTSLYRLALKECQRELKEEERLRLRIAEQERKFPSAGYSTSLEGKSFSTEQDTQE